MATESQPKTESPKPASPKFESWGRYPKLHADLVPLSWTTDFPLPQPPATKMLPVGAGRSYGDVCLLENGTLLKTRGMDRLLHFDPQTGVLRCEAGVTLAEILDFGVPRGFFLPVSPGTKYVTIGGAIANDIHGKNHHVAGTFGCHVLRFELVRSDGARFVCSPTENADWFSATVGGMGLTGLISWAEIRLRPIVSRKIQYKGTKFVGIDEFVALSKASTHVEYTVAWIDCVATGNNFARGIFMEGDHSEQPEPLKRSKEPWLLLPLDVPEFALNKFSIGLFNTLYYNKQLGKEKPASSITSRFSIRSTAFCTGTACTAKAASCNSSACCRGKRTSRWESSTFSKPSLYPVLARFSPSSRSSETYLRRECFPFPHPALRSPSISLSARSALTCLTAWPALRRSMEAVSIRPRTRA